MHFQKVLVLGEQGIAQIIAEQLKREGFEPVFQKNDPQNLSQLKQLLEDFAKQVTEPAMVHPGSSFWADRPELATYCQEAGLTLIAPSSRNLALFNNQLNFLFEAAQLGIPHLVLSFDPIFSVREIEALLKTNGKGFPFVLKSVQRGGRFGLFVVEHADSIVQDLPLWMDQLRWNVGEVILFVEKYLESARHLVLPFARFQNGDLKFFPVIDASLQSHHRKLIEFCPAQKLDSETFMQMTQWTQTYLEKCSYVGVGTFEFLVDGPRAFLISGTAQMTSSFYLWDQVAGTSTVAWQLATLTSAKIPEGLDSEKNTANRFGIAFRIFAEDSRFLHPRPGILHEFFSSGEEFKGSRSVRVCAHYQKGDQVSVSGDGLIGQVFATTGSQNDLLSWAKECLKKLWIAGSIQTNEQYLLELLDHPWIREHIFHAGFLDEEFLSVWKPSPEMLELCVALCQEVADLNERPSRWLIGQQHSVRVQEEPGMNAHWAWVNPPYVWEFENRRGLSGEISFQGGERYRIGVFPSKGRWFVRIGSWTTSVRCVLASVDQSRQTPRKLMALVAGRVHALLFREGAQATPHEALAVIESLGVFIPHAVPVGIRILEWKVQPNQEIYFGQELAEIHILSE